jgi:ribose 5-phosphate isomerase A
MTPQQLDFEKQTVARAALRWVCNGMRLGLGSGSTAGHFIIFLGERVQAGELTVEAVPTSRETERLARRCQIPLIEPARRLRLDLYVDGADEIAGDLALIKGRGGALLREKVVARATHEFLVLGDSSKRCEKLGRGPLPVEAVPFAVPWVMDEIEKMGGEPALRSDPKSSGEPFRTDQGNWILDCRFGLIDDPLALAARLASIPGVAAHGLFIGYAGAALVAEGNDVLLLRSGAPPRPAY